MIARRCPPIRRQARSFRPASRLTRPSGVVRSRRLTLRIEGVPGEVKGFHGDGLRQRKRRRRHEPGTAGGPSTRTRGCSASEPVTCGINAEVVYDTGTGQRVFPLIAVGATAGSNVGAKLAQTLFDRGASPLVLLQVASVILVAHLALYWLIERRVRRGGEASPPARSANVIHETSRPATSAWGRERSQTKRSNAAAPSVIRETAPSTTSFAAPRCSGAKGRYACSQLMR